MRSESPVSRYLPVGYFALTIALIAAILPSALRPPPSQPPTSAELSPDAPPEDNELLLTELARGSSGTAGAGSVTGQGPQGDLKVPTAPVRPRRGRCFGDPPRQTESFYSAPCAGAFVGDNGGATWKGVTANEVRIVVTRNSNTSYEGAVDERNPTLMNAVERTYFVYQRYLNDNFEFYGRRLRLFIVNTSSRQFQDAPESRAGVAKADTEFNVFGLVVGGGNPPAEDEGIRRKLVVFGGSQNPMDYYIRNAPYAYSFKVDADKLRTLSAELMCKQLHGKPPSFNDRADPTFDYSKPRKFGVLTYADMTHYGGVEGYKREFKEQCGGEFVESGTHNFDQSTDQIAANITKMRAAGVTTIVMATDSTVPIIYTRAAQNAGYFPEWVMPGTGGTDENSNGRLYEHRTQWKNTIGITTQEIARAEHEKDFYRAYKSVDPEDEPDGELNFYELLQMANAIQLAGPKLTPDTFQAGLQKRFPRRPPDPVWSVGGGYGPGDWTYPDYVSLVWWDASGDDPDSSLSGAYSHVYAGRRFTFGEIPTEPIPFFKEGITMPSPA